MIAVARRAQPQPARPRGEEPRDRSGASKKKQRLQPAGQRSGTGAASVMPYLSLPR